MSATVIEKIINEIYELVENSKPQPFSTQSKIIVQRDELLDLVDELKRRTPDEIARYQKIIAKRDSIIAKAEEDAKAILADAQSQAQQLIDQTEIMQQAYAQANELIQNAKDESEKLKADSENAAETLRTGVLSYAADILAEVESLIDASYRETKENSDRLVSSLNSKLNMIRDNRHEVMEQLNGENVPAQEEQYSDENYDFPEGTFFKDVE